MTNFIYSHPGGADVLEDVAGKDGTDDFEGTYHSKKARDMCMEYLIGKVKGAELGELHKPELWLASQAKQWEENGLNRAVAAKEDASSSWFFKFVIVVVAMVAYIYIKSIDVSRNGKA